MRTDLIIDGFTFTRVKVGGMDSTERIIEMYLNLKRNDINILLLNGCVISWYNVIDLNRLSEETDLPVLCVTYKESEGLEKHFKNIFPDDYKERVEVYRRNGPRTAIKIRTGHRVYVRFLKMKKGEARGILNRFTINGAVPEPLRVARLLARSIMKSKILEDEEYRPS